MKVPQMVLAELRRLFSSRMSIIALVALLAVPILYGGLYLWANQDPYGRLAQVPVALVVEDAGATIDGTARNLGDEVAADLLESGTFDWHRVDAAAAEAGLDDGTYDFSIEVPADFTASIASITSDAPRQATLQLRTNDANNYLATTIGTQAVEKIRATVAEKVVSEAGLTLLDALATIRVQLTDAASGAGRLVDGLGTAGTGASALTDGATQLADGTARLRDGSTRLASGAQQVAAGTQQLDAVAGRVGAAAAEVTAALPSIRTDIADRLAARGLTPAEIDEVLAALDPLGEKVEAVDQRVQSAVGQIDRLNAGAEQVSAGSAELAQGAASAADGAARLQAGAAALGTGLDQLSDGATQLRDGLQSGVGQLPDTDAATRQKQAATIGNPVDIDTSTVAQAQNYGAGLAPFFAALAAWIGIYALFLIVKPISRRAVTALHSPIRVTLAGWATPAILGGVQMIGLFAVLSLALGFQFANPLATLGILLLASATYAAIILALNVWFGSVGQFLGLVLMVLQLVTAGGTFPWQTLPAPLAALHHVLPMSYVVDAMRQVMYGGDPSRVWLDLGVLLLWLAAAGVAAAIGVTRMTHFRTLRDLQPSIIG
ncbi:YhgE/Pip family protein [Microbacterium sp.]|uniref:YhgE/Pip family protein n=1 Tax=Microbacterium sp. TaxID=51671 RepID=UPI003F709499